MPINFNAKVLNGIHILSVLYKTKLDSNQSKMKMFEIDQVREILFFFR